MKILYILEHYYPYIGGSERLFQTLAEAMAEKGNEVTVLTSHFDPSLPKTEILNGVEVMRIRAQSRFSFTWKATFALYHLVKDYDIIHTTTYNAALPAWISTRLRSKKLILTFHEVWGDLWFRLPFTRWWERILFYSFEKLVVLLPFDHYIAVSKFTETSLIANGVSPRKISQIYNGIDYDEFVDFQHQGVINQPIKFLYFGRLGTSKGLDIILESFANVEKDHNCQLHLVVPKTPRRMWDLVQNMIEDLGLREKVSFYHNLSKADLYHLISVCDAALIPSLSEGFCFSAVEANAIGIPIIHSGKGALSEVLQGSNSIQVDPSVKNLVQGMRQFMESRKGLNTKVVEWPIAKTIVSTYELYTKVLYDTTGSGPSSEV